MGKAKTLLPTGGTTFVDAHVHIHDCCEIDRFLEAAAENFASIAHGPDDPGRGTYVLCLTESKGVNRFRDLLQQTDVKRSETNNSPSAWTFEKTNESVSVTARGPAGQQLTIIAGRQIVTCERIEILGLGSLDNFPDGQSAVETIVLLLRNGSWPVVPWGFGKWLGARKRVVRELLQHFDSSELALGDNSGRPWFLPTPIEFKIGERDGFKILPGTDPLPFHSEWSRAGSYGFRIAREIGSSTPWSELHCALAIDGTHISPYGRLENPIRFTRNQVAMQYVARRRDRN